MKKLVLSIVIVCLVLMAGSASLFAQVGSTFSACSKESGRRKTFGYRFGLRIPKGSKFERGGDIDFSSIHLSFGNGKQRVWMSGMSGANATGGKPTKRMLESSDKFQKLDWKVDELEGVDYKGVSKDGTHWRYLGFLGEAIWYDNMSQEAAAFFDKVFDDVCFYTRK